MPSEGSGAWLKRFKAKQKSREDDPSESAKPAGTPAGEVVTAAAVPQASVFEGSAASKQAGSQMLDVAVADVLDDDGFVREDADVDDDVAEAVQAMQAEANAKRLRRRRMGIPADGAGQTDDAIAGDGHTIRLRVDASGAVIKSDNAAAERRSALTSGSAAGSAGVLQSDFADTGKRERPAAASDTGGPAAARQRINPRQREQELSRRAEAVRNHRLALRRAEEEKASQALAATEAEKPASGDDGSMTLDAVVNNGGAHGDAITPAATKDAEVAVAPVVNAGVWTSAPTTDAAPEPSSLPMATEAPAASTEAAAKLPSGALDVAGSDTKPKKKKANVFAVAKQLVKERSGGEHVHGGGASAVDKTYGRRDEQGRLLSATEAFKALSKDFDTSRGK